MRDWAKAYIDQGYQVVPLSPGTKACKDESWLKLVFQPDDFEPNDNLGIRSVNGLVIIDLDSIEAVALADDFLPPTDAIYGRPSKPKSKRLYRSSIPKTIPFKLEAGMGVEIRSEHQDMAPPSIHPSGERLAWVSSGQPSEVVPEILIRSCRLLTTAVLVGRGYAAPGGRHDWCLALSGTLRQLGLTQEETERCIIAAALLGEDTKIEDRRLEIRTTYNRPDDDPIKGHKALIEIIGEGGKEFIAALHKIWGGRTSLFVMDAKGEKILANDLGNIRKALEKLGLKASYDRFAERVIIEYDGAIGPAHDAVIRRAWFAIDQKFHFRPQKELFWDVVEDLAHANTFHPVIDYLDRLQWDGESRLDTWLIRSAGAADTPYVRAISAMILIAAVRRVRKPGAKFDELTVLEGVQGQLKSSALRALCPHEDWFSDDLPLNVDAKQIIERTLGKWIIEASELSGMSPGQVEHLKGLLARQVDGPVRMAYARMPIERPRQFILIGTTNAHTYLVDETGNRRFWPLRVGTFDLSFIRQHRDQLWAEAARREADGASIRLSKDLWEHASIQQERRRTTDPWEETLENAFPEHDQRMETKEAWEALGVPISMRTTQMNARLGRVLQLLGYRRQTIRGKDGKVTKGWARGDVMRNDTLKLTNAPHKPRHDDEEM
jgi:hypothetical protein